ncbi:hypothetical protein D1013_11550 [Euzebyella marina]|uniref:Uncharacterized protein n=1 Tax=Euzebyella marina TaxID=1761453 RepID=A0A3G2L6R0_9FLAO|nr:hypothetical protein [Euzebyella marina]AYN67964.1 hypothetical protein D1013_11550 [Euzebyella marina]
MAKKSNPVTVKIDIKGQSLQKDLQIFVFDKNENLLEATALNKEQIKLKTSANEIKSRGQIFIGPSIPKEFEKRKLTPVTIKKMGGYEPSIRLDVNNDITISKLPNIIFPNWYWCLITGNLSKTFTIDGQNETLPICEARVHICEVDRIKWWWPKIPRAVITDLGKKLKEILTIPEVKFPPLPDPGPLRPPIRPITGFTEKASNNSEALQRISTLKLPDDVKLGLLSESSSVVSDTIYKNFHLLHPYLCLWPWFWPYFYRCTEIATVYSDCNGHFDYNYFNFDNDKDIYVWVEVNIDGQWVTVYRPPMSCYTKWNYNCGSEINIRITDPRVKPCECSPIPGAIVWMKRINSGVRLRKVQQNNGSSEHLTNAIGLTDFITAGQKVSPFGGSFPFVVQFGSGFPNSTVSHYRWSYKRLKDAYLTSISDVSHHLEGNINKSYTYEVSTPTGTVFATGAFNLGPTYNSGKPKYKIPHVEASDDVPSEPTAEWNQDTSSIYVNTSGFADGLYEFTFELLDNSGNVMPVDAKTFVVDRLSSDPTGETTISADGLPENYLVKNTAGKAIAFTFKMRIDNQACYADVLDAIVDGNTTDTACGVGRYDNKTTDKAIIRFLAGQPLNFAYYGFNIVKGNSNAVPVANSAGYVTQSDNGYSISTILDAGVQKTFYKKQLNVSDMLGSCNMAAFAEVLRVRATHTNGSVRISSYDSEDVGAIAMATS